MLRCSPTQLRPRLHGGGGWRQPARCYFWSPRRLLNPGLNGNVVLSSYADCGTMVAVGALGLARVILGSAEAAIAGQFVEAAMTYADHPAALQLRAMNIIYETTKERGATILIPTSMVDSMNPVVALALAGQDTASQKANGPLPLTPNTRKESVAAPQAGHGDALIKWR
jgi:hypothetical protein